MRARKAATRAHCPYSNFHVGAAVRCDDGSVIDGCNVENASYGLSICAERVALFTAVSQGKRPLELAVSCVDDQTDASPGSRMPCGACRQVMQNSYQAMQKSASMALAHSHSISFCQNHFTLTKQASSNNYGYIPAFNKPGYSKNH